MIRPPAGVLFWGPLRKVVFTVALASFCLYTYSIMLYDFHTHTVLSDGILCPAELIRQAAVRGYTAVGLTDHASSAQMARVIEETSRACALTNRFWEIKAVPGIELTHVPAASIPELASEAKSLGAKIVVVHGETIVEPVEPGTDLIACECPDVDILAHPGIGFGDEAAKAAAANDIYVEVTSRRGHCLSNGFVVAQCRKFGCKMIVNSDAHAPEDLHTEEFVREVALGAGLTDDEITAVLVTHPQELLARIGS